VETYRNQLVVKFGARNAVDLVHRAVESGFLVGQ
jgi:DNA-binding CsgD family transcriptional regulator